MQINNTVIMSSPHGWPYS